MELWTGALSCWKCHWPDLKRAGLFRRYLFLNSCSRKNFVFLFDALINLTVRVDAYFHRIRMTYPILSDHFSGQHQIGESLPNTFSSFNVGRRNYCPLSFVFLFDALINLTVRVDAYFHRIRMTYPILSDHFSGQHQIGESLPNTFSSFNVGRRNYCPLSF